MALRSIELVDPVDCLRHNLCIKLYGYVDDDLQAIKIWPSSNKDTVLWAEFIRQAVLAASDAEIVGWNVGDDVMQIAHLAWIYTDESIQCDTSTRNLFDQSVDLEGGLLAIYMNPDNEVRDKIRPILETIALLLGKLDKAVKSRKPRISVISAVLAEPESVDACRAMYDMYIN